MDPGVDYSLGASSSSAASNQADVSNPFVNNAEIVFGSDDFFGESGIGSSSPTQTSTQTPTATTSVGPSPTQGYNSVPLSSPVAASGHTLVYGLVVAGILLALVIHHK
jgi:hypothetical protein